MINEINIDSIETSVQRKDIAKLQEAQSEVFTIVNEYRNKATKSLTQKEFNDNWCIADEVFKTLNYINYNIGLILDK